MLPRSVKKDCDGLRHVRHNNTVCVVLLFEHVAVSLALTRVFNIVVRLCFVTHPSACVGRDSSVGIATRYELDGPGIESLWGRDFQHRPDRPPSLPSLLHSGYRVFPGGKAAGAWS